MSLNAQRFARTRHPLVVSDTLVAPDPAGEINLHRWMQELREAQAINASIEASEAHWREQIKARFAEELAQERKGRGVAWVAHLKYEVRCSAQVLRIPKRRGVVVQRGHKLCWLQLPI